ncbi:MAG: GldG family protein [Candidatus Poribacteria bacterium]|nr:GldG family protein [Candidatus Poribacteria bacterium]
MITRTLKYGSNTLVFVIVVFGIVALMNFLSTRRFVRADLTDDKRYTISSSTKKVLKRLDDIVTINAYFSRQPARVAQIRQSIRDVLDEYRAFSNNLQIDFIDPASDDETEKQKLRFMGIPEVQVNVIEKDKAEVANVYMGIAVLYEDKKEVLPVVQNTFTLEYDLTSAILKVTSKEVKTVGFLTGHDEFDITDQAFEPLQRELSKQYSVRNVPIDDGKEIDPDVATLIIAGPQQKLTEREKYEIDQFIMRGGRAVFLIDSIRMPEGTMQATPLATGLSDLLEHYGVKLGNNLVLDRYHDNASFRQGFITYSLPYPYWVKVIKPNFSKDHIITGQLERLTLPWPSSLELLSGADESIEMVELAKTSNAGWTVQSPYNIDPNNRLSPPTSKRGTYTVAAALSGVFKSFYANKEIPTVESSESEDDELPKPTDEERTTKTESEPTQIIVVGNSRFLQQGRPDGQIFFLNTVDWLTLGEDLINIRSHGVTDRPLKEVSESEKFFLKFLSIAGVPILVVVFGLVRFFLRRRAKRLVEIYGAV